MRALVSLGAESGGTEPKRRRVDTSGVRLPDALVELVPVLAENVHEVWAGQRASEGWRYGPSRDDLAKQHPGLVDFAALPESEREYDRLVVTEVLKALLALGYRIER